MPQPSGSKGQVLPPTTVRGPAYRTAVEATVMGDAVADLIVEFSRAIAGRQPHYAWRDTTGMDGRVVLTITSEDQVSGYYLARARTAGGEIVGQWHSIPLNDNRRQVLELTLGGGVRVVAVEGLAASKKVGGSTIPAASSLEPNHPNPFNSSTVIPYGLAVPGPVAAGDLQHSGAAGAHAGERVPVRWVLPCLLERPRRAGR